MLVYLTKSKYNIVGKVMKSWLNYSVLEILKVTVVIKLPNSLCAAY